MHKHRIALIVALVSVIGVMVAATVQLAQAITWGQLKCIYEGNKTKADCIPGPQQVSEDKNTG